MIEIQLKHKERNETMEGSEGVSESLVERVCEIFDRLNECENVCVSDDV